MKKRIKNLNEMNKFANLVVGGLNKKTNDKAVVLGLFGDLGSGKTTFTQNLAGIFGVKQVVTSPTFVIEKIYRLPSKQKFKHIIHIDAYRLDSEQELVELGWNEISKDKNNIIVIEWPEKIEKILPNDMEKIYFKFIDEDTREIKY